MLRYYFHSGGNASCRCNPPAPLSTHTEPCAHLECPNGAMQICNCCYRWKSLIVQPVRQVHNPKALLFPGSICLRENGGVTQRNVIHIQPVDNNFIVVKRCHWKPSFLFFRSFFFTAHKNTKGTSDQGSKNSWTLNITLITKCCRRQGAAMQAEEEKNVRFHTSH